MSLKRILTNIYYHLPIKFLLKNIILFESNPDFSDNSRAVFDELIKHGYNKNNKLVWLVSSKEDFIDIHENNVEFINYSDTKTIRKYQFLAKYIIDCNKFVDKKNKYQYRIHLTHGAPIKFVREYCDKCGNIDLVIAISDYFKNITSELFHVSKSKVVITGYPRNDILLRNNNYVFYPELKRRKTICWLPTYRNHINSSSGKNLFPYGIPAVKSLNELKKLDKILEDEKTLLIIKLHPAEDISIIRQMDLKYIKFLSNNYFSDNHLTIYHYLANVDALITDYSSIYYDFLLTKKPIGLAIEDYDEYSLKNEMFFDKYKDGIVGEYIYNFNDLLKFIDNVVKNKDISYEHRMEKMKLYYKYFDDKSSERIIALLEKGGLKK